MIFSKISITALLVVASIFAVKAQKNIEYIEDEVQKIENVLYQKDKSATLTNEQKSGLYVILEEKYKKIQGLIHTGQDKYGIHTSLVVLNTEYTPKIAAVLTPSQRLAYIKIAK